MMVLIDRKFNKEQFLLKIFFPKMHIERAIRKKVISMGLKPHKKKFQVWGVFCRLILQFFSSFVWSLDYKESVPFFICRREMKLLGEL